MRGPLVTLVDGALPEALFARLLRAVKRVGEERLNAGYQTTFWFDFDEAPSSVVEEAALALRAHVPARVRARAAGVEWWLSRQRTSNVKVDFHRDRDNARFDRTGAERHPLLGSVLYLNRCRGGLLAVTREPPDEHNPARAPARHDFDFVTPAPNRYAFFAGGLTHGVLDARNRLPGGRLPRERALRLAIAVNYWPRCPEAVPRFAASPHFRRLSSRPTSALRRRP